MAFDDDSRSAGPSGTTVASAEAVEPVRPAALALLLSGSALALWFLTWERRRLGKKLLH